MLREPQLIKCCSNGDHERFLWVMEPERGRIFGKSFEITGLQMATLTEDEIAKIKTDNYDVMIERSKNDQNVMPEGSYFDAFA